MVIHGQEVKLYTEGIEPLAFDSQFLVPTIPPVSMKLHLPVLALDQPRPQQQLRDEVMVACLAQERLHPLDQTSQLRRSCLDGCVGQRTFPQSSAARQGPHRGFAAPPSPYIDDQNTSTTNAKRPLLAQSSSRCEDDPSPNGAGCPCESGKLMRRERIQQD